MVLINCILGKWPACIHQSAPEGYFKTEDCRAEKYFVCKMNQNSEFLTPPRGCAYLYFFLKYQPDNINYSSCLPHLHSSIICLEYYIHSPDYLSSYPNGYEQVNKLINPIVN